MYTLHNERTDILLLEWLQFGAHELDQIYNLLVSLFHLAVQRVLGDGLLGLLGPVDLAAVEHTLALPLLDPFFARDLSVVFDGSHHGVPDRVDHFVFHDFAPDLDGVVGCLNRTQQRDLFALLRTHVRDHAFLVEDQKFHALEDLSQLEVDVLGVLRIGEDLE